jgi:threonine dehydratase
VHPFDDPDVIAGQGTVAMEILRQHQGAGSTPCLRRHWRRRPGVRRGQLHQGGAIPDPRHRRADERFGRHDRSVAAGKRVTLADVGLFSDGTAVKLVGEETFRVARGLVDEFVTVDTDAVCAAIKDVFVDTRSIVEPAGARWRWRRSSSTWPRTRPRARPTPPSCAAPT